MKGIFLKKVIYAALLLVLVAAGVWVYRWMKIDSCLDLGGKLDYRENHCITQ